LPGALGRHVAGSKTAFFTHTIPRRPLKNSDGFFSDYYLERLFPDEELGAFPEDQAKELLKQIAKLLETTEPSLRTADAEETVARWFEPVLFKALGASPARGGRIVTEDAVFQPDFVLPKPGASVKETYGDLRGKAAGETLSCLIWTLPWRASLDSVATEGSFTALPVTEVVHRALIASEVPWAIISNGRQLRLLSRTSSHKPRCFLEADLIALIDRRTDQQALRAIRFVLGLFSARCFTEVDQAGQSLLERVAEGSDRHGKEIGDELKENVFSALQELGEGFLAYMRANAKATDEWGDENAPKLSREKFLTSDVLLEDIYHESLSLMYRLLFLFYAESRELLPLDNELYQTYSLESIRDDVHSVQDDPDPRRFFAKGNTDLWARLSELFGFLDKGWGKVIPPYNGGLFDPERHEFLERFAVGDYYLARAIDLLSRTKPRIGQSRGEGRKKVTYRDLDVRHLGSIYEGILEYAAHIADQDYVILRQGSGTSAAEEYKAVLELDRTEKAQFAAWQDAVEENPESPRPPRNCKVSGSVEKGRYYLVFGGRESKRKSSGSYYTPDYIVQYIVENTLGPLVRGAGRLKPESIAPDLKAIGWKEEPERIQRIGPLSSEEILSLRILDPAMGSGHFLVAATEYLARAYRDARLAEGAVLDEANADQEFIRYKRIIAERCIYGVDLNLMAVELAKLSMWLFTMDPGRPLSFLDRNFRCGNALLGGWMDGVGQLPFLNQSGKVSTRPRHAQQNLFEYQFRQRLPVMIQDVFKIIKKETTSPQDIRDKKTWDAAIADVKDPYQRVMDRWVGSFLGDDPGDYYSVLADVSRVGSSTSPAARRAAAFHWELEFPEVWFDDLGRDKRFPGFDAIIGNPPYYLLQGREEQRTFELLYPEFYSGSDDVLYYFMKLQVELIREGGIGSFIVSRYWSESSNADQLRNLIGSTCSLRQFVDFRNFQPFGTEVSVLSSIPFIQRGKHAPPAEIIRFEDFFMGDEDGASAKLRSAQAFCLEDPQDVCKFEKPQDFFGLRPWFLSPEPVDDLLARMESNSVTLGNIALYTQGIKTGLNRAFIVKATDAQKLRLEESLLLRLVKGKDILPFAFSDADDYLIYTHDGIDIDDYPQIKKHLKAFQSELEARAECNTGLYPWWRLQRPRDAKIMLARKLLTPIYATHNRFAYSVTKPYAVGVTDSCSFAINPESGISVLFACGILNSTAGQFYHKRRAKLKRASYYEYFVETLQDFPIPKVQGGVQGTVEKIVQRLALTKPNSEGWRTDRSDLDDVVYSIFGFSSRETRAIAKLSCSAAD
jgi:hypothetical protein